MKMTKLRGTFISLEGWENIKRKMSEGITIHFIKRKSRRKKKHEYPHQSKKHYYSYRIYNTR